MAFRLRSSRKGSGGAGGGALTVGVLADPTTPNGFYRVIGPAEALERRGHAVRRIALGTRPDAVLGGLDVLLVHRYFDDGALRLLRAAADAGVAVVWDDDDDFSSVPRDSPGYRRFGGIHAQRRIAAIRRLLPLVDVATAPSAVLAERLAGAGARETAVLPNFVPPEFTRASPHRHDGVVVGWVAGLEHQVDYDKLGLKKVFEQLLSQHADLRFSAVGLGMGLPAERFEHDRLLTLGQLPQRIAGFDVALAPLVDIPFNRARSDIKVKEYAAVGVPWLASPVGPYAGLGQQEGGRLVADGAWLEALSQLISSARDRKTLAKQAERWGREQSIEANAGRWEDVLRSAIARRRETLATATG